VPRASGTIVPGSVSGGTGLGGSGGITVIVEGFMGTEMQLTEAVRKGLYEINRRNPGALPGVA
jgi:hypothetical protein